MTDHELTYLSLEQKRKLQEISIKYTKTINEMMYELAEMVTEGSFKWCTTVGYLDIKIGKI